MRFVESNITVNHRETWAGGVLNMADHRVVGEAAIDAVRDAANRWLFPELGEPWSGVRRVAVMASPRDMHVVTAPIRLSDRTPIVSPRRQSDQPSPSHASRTRSLANGRVINAPPRGRPVDRKYDRLN